MILASKFSASSAALFFSLFLGIFSSTTWASVSENTTEWIVRYRTPQETRLQAMNNTLSLTESASDLAGVEVLNAPEGVVKLSFATPESALEAKEALEASDEVLSVSPNFLYRPALSLKAKEVVDEFADDGAALQMPWASWFSAVRSFAGAIPEVRMPSAAPRVGADPLAARDWALASIRLPATRILPTTRARVITAVIDTGVDYNHEDLIGAMWRKPGNPQEVGYDFAHNHARPFDVVLFDIEGCMKDRNCSMGIDTEKYLVNSGHGTHCAGHVGAVINNSIGMRGVGEGTQVMGLKFFYDAGERNAGQGDDSAAIRSIDYAIRNGAKVISASWGGRMNRANGERSELKQALIRAQQAGVLVVIAAGNDGIDQDRAAQPSYPAAYNLDNLIVVAASDPRDQLAEFSNYGARSVHIAAPGVKILSTISGGGYNDVVARYRDSKGVVKQIDWDGTSMATPIVAGAVAAVWAKYPTATYQQIRARILSTARKAPGLTGKVATGGVLDVNAALGPANRLF